MEAHIARNWYDTRNSNLWNSSPLSFYVDMYHVAGGESDILALGGCVLRLVVFVTVG